MVRKALLWTFGSVLFTHFVMSLPTVYVINGAPFKSYNPTFDTSECVETLERVPTSYLEGVRGVKLFSASSRWIGFYFYWTKVIHLYGSCSSEVLVHEIAHHCQHIRGDSHYQAKNHEGLFYECEDEIWENMS